MQEPWPRPPSMDPDAIAAAERAVVYLTVDWSGPERTSRRVVHDALAALADVEFALFVIDEEADAAKPWLALHTGAAAARASDTLLCLERGTPVAIEPRPGEVGSDAIAGRIRELWSPSPTLEAPATRQPPRRVWLRRLCRVWVALAIAFASYLWLSYRAVGFDAAVLRSDGRVSVVDASDRITFAPAGAAARSALVFLPGAMVEPTAYAPLLRAVAERGHRVVLLRLPWRMASTESQRRAIVARVAELIRAEPQARWVVAGHSAGGAMAARVARDHPALPAGIVLIGTSHPRDFDLSRLPLDVTQITASRDGLASPAEVLANARLLPADTRHVVIGGGNHSQFGHYGRQLGDRDPTISRDAQQARTLEAMLAALDRAAR